jgi:predicted GIY-YIG superfamily endonuclease
MNGCPSTSSGRTDFEAVIFLQTLRVFGYYNTQSLVRQTTMSFWVYILKCTDGSYYTGHTDNLEKRIEEHQSGACGGYTLTRLPVELAFSQDFPTREEALTSERQIKGWSRKKKEAMIRGDWNEVSRLSRGTK